ncbi:hypothetical protein HPB49_005515 [Dermacentor silvarum]|uniref:Uncharacterized protein n=1 Tax=Dermacentor silvarum TaxID=543639 RepID=A0ACB8DVR2_DERSI|nr:hypothetical protein HPB49_005515 [Dermacentor silvarum]
MRHMRSSPESLVPLLNFPARIQQQLTLRREISLLVSPSEGLDREGSHRRPVLGCGEQPAKASDEIESHFGGAGRRRVVCPFCQNDYQPKMLSCPAKPHLGAASPATPAVMMEVTVEGHTISAQELHSLKPPRHSGNATSKAANPNAKKATRDAAAATCSGKTPAAYHLRPRRQASVIKNAYEDETPTQLYQELVRRNPEYTILAARHMGKTQSILITFDTNAVPHYIKYMGAIHRCTPYRGSPDASTNCRQSRHRHDVCPSPKTNLCPRCGTRHSLQDPPCTPKCILCEGPHLTSTRSCKRRNLHQPRKQPSHPEAQQQESVAPRLTTPTAPLSQLPTPQSTLMMAAPNSNLTLWQWNCRGFGQKRHVVHQLLSCATGPDILALQEPSIGTHSPSLAILLFCPHPPTWRILLRTAYPLWKKVAAALSSPALEASVRLFAVCTLFFVVVVAELPTILPNLPAYLSKSTPTPRPQRKRRQLEMPCDTSSKARRTDQCHQEGDHAADTAVGSEECQGSERVAEADNLSVAGLRRLSLPTKSWALHEFPDFTGVCYVCCELNAATSEIRVARTVFFNSGIEGIVECKGTGPPCRPSEGEEHFIRQVTRQRRLPELQPRTWPGQRNRESSAIYGISDNPNKQDARPNPASDMSAATRAPATYSARSMEALALTAPTKLRMRSTWTQQELRTAGL